MKTRLRWSFTITICTLLTANVALAQETPKQDSGATVTIVTAGDISVTRTADGKAAVSINFVPGKAKSGDTRITISGPYSLDVNGGVKEVKMCIRDSGNPAATTKSDEIIQTAHRPHPPSQSRLRRRRSKIRSKM